MNIKNFVKNFIEAIEDESIQFLSSDTNFKQLDCWDSMTALCIMSMVDAEYQVNINADDLRSVSTIQELFSLIESKVSV